MSILQEKLSERFNALIQLKDPEKFFLAFAEYVSFIQETPPLPGIARRIFSKGHSTEVSRFYKTLQQVSREEDDAPRKIWADTHRGVLGLPSQYETGIFGFMTDIRLMRAQVRLFHSAVLDELPRSSIGDKTLLLFKKSEGALCTAGEEKHCYVMKRGEKQQRFRIITFLLRESASASALAKRFSKTDKHSSQANLKNEITQINKNFRRNLLMQDDLIVSRKHGVKNIYSFNAEVFEFRNIP